MSVRYLVTVDPDADADAVAAGLRAAGAEAVSTPAPELPDVFIATVDESVADYADRARGVAGVQVAEPDAWVGFGGDPDDPADADAGAGA
ncbi:hypothetical protein ACFFIR_15710, partial [Microbacterium arthrosphaerae]